MNELSLKMNTLANTKANELIYVLLGLLPVFILVNRFPYFSISIFLVFFIISLFFFFSKRIISHQHLGVIILLLIIFSYILFSYLISRQSILDLFNYNFLRFDGDLIFSYMPFFIFAVPFLNYKKALKIYFWVLFIIFAFFSIIGFIEYSNGITVFAVRLDDFYVGPMFVALNHSHNATGSVFSVVGIFALAFFFESKKIEKISYGLISLLCFIAIFMTKSRGSLIAFAIGVFFLLIFASGSLLKFLRNILIIIAIMVPLVFITGTYTRIMQIFHIFDQSALTRFELWDKGVYLFKQSPILGVGFARYNDVAWNYDVVPLTGNSGIFSLYTSGSSIFNDTNAHNSYLHFLAEIGIVGLILFLLFWVLCLVITIRAYRQTNNRFSRQVYLAVTGGIITLFFLSITETFMTAPTVMLCLATATSLAIGLWGSERSGKLPK